MDEIEKSIISIELDASATQKTLKGMGDIEKARKGLGSGLKQLAGDNASYSQSLRQVIANEDKAESSLVSLGSEFNKQSDNIRSATSQLDSYSASLREVKSNSELASGFGQSFGQIGGALNQVGLGGGGQALGLGQAGADILEFAPQLKVQLEAVGESFRAGSSLGASFATNAGGVIASLTGVSASMGAFLAIALPIAVAVGAVTLALGQYNQAMQEQADQLATVLDVQSRVSEQVADGLTTDDATARLADLERQRAAEQSLLDERQAAYDAAISQLGIIGGLAQQISPQEQVLADAIAENTANITAYDAEIRELNNQLTDGSLAANDTAQAELELANTRIADSQRAIAEAEAANSRIASLEQQRSSMIENRVIAENNASQVENLNARFAREDNKAQLVDHFNKLADISEAGNQRLEQLATEAANLPLEQAKKDAEIEAKGNQQLKKLSDDYFQNQIKAYESFANESGRIASDTAKAAKRLAEDIRDNLSDAARENDVIAFLKIQRDGEKELKRNAEDADEAEKRRAEDFANQQENQRQAYEQRNQEILNQVAQEKTANAQAFAEKAQALELQRQQELANIQASIANENTRFQQQEAREAQAANRQAQRDALRQSQEDAAFNRSLAAINNKVSAELAGLARVAAAANSLGSKYAPQPKPTSYGGYGSSYQKPSLGYGSGSTSATVINNVTVGDVATGSQVSNAIEQATQSIQKAVLGGLQKAQGG